MSAPFEIPGFALWDPFRRLAEVPIDIKAARTWAYSRRIIRHQGQLVLPDTIKKLEGHFSGEDMLLFTVHVFPDDQGRLWYFEYIQVPVKALIEKGKPVSIKYWQLLPTRWDRDGNVLRYEHARFFFNFPGVHTEKLCSDTVSKQLCKQFSEIVDNDSVKHERKVLQDRSLEIRLAGAMEVTFFKTGNSYDSIMKHIEKSE